MSFYKERLKTKMKSVYDLVIKTSRKIFIDDPVVKTEEFNEYAVENNVRRSIYISLGILFLGTSTLYRITDNADNNDMFLKATYIFLIIIAALSAVIYLIFRNNLIENKTLGKNLIAFYWIIIMICKSSSFYYDALTSVIPLSVTTWQVAISVILILSRRNILIICLLFTIYNIGIALYANAPTSYIVDVTVRCFLGWILANFMLYPYYVAMVKNIINSNIDPLTGLKNRRGGMEKIEKISKTRKNQNRIAAFYMIDVDDFKAYNDTYGHQNGDVILKMISGDIDSVFPCEECVNIRYGGEEIVVFALLDDESKANDLGEELLEKIRQNKIKSGEGAKKEYLTISIGYVTVLVSEINNENIDKYINAADEAMYWAKSRGKDQMVRGLAN